MKKDIKIFNTTTKNDRFSIFEGRLQFTIVMVMFFPALLGNLFSYIKDSTGLPETLTNWNVIIGLFIAIYVFTEVIKNNFAKEWITKWINTMLLIEIIAFLPLLLLGLMKNIEIGWIIWLYQFITSFSVLSMMTIPAGILILFIVNTVLSDLDSRG